MKPLLLIAILFTPLPALAQVYKCVENGKTIYAERPCGAKAQEINVGDSPATQQRLQAEERGRQAGLKEAQKHFDEAARIRQEGADKIAERRAARAAQQPSKQDRCNSILRDIKRAKDDQILYQSPGFVADARRRQKEAEDAHFSECYGS